MSDRAIAEYHEWLAADERLTPDLFAQLREGMTATHLLYGDRQIGVALRPHLIARVEYDALTRAAESVASAFEKLAAAMIVDHSLLDRVGLTRAERRLALADP